jgi:O-antigen ligase
MRAAQLSSFLAFVLLPLIFDMHCADPTGEPKLACWLLAAGLAAMAPHKPWSLAERFLAAWFGWATFSAAVNGISVAWVDLLTIGAGLLWVRAPKPKRHLFMGLGFGLSVTYAWMQHLKLDPFEWSTPELSVTRGIAGLGNPNYLAMYLACLSPWAWSYLYPRGPLGWLAGFLSLTALLLTATRGSILILICMLAIGTVYSLFKNRRLGRYWVFAWLMLALSWPWSTRLSANQHFGMAGQMQSLRKGSDMSVVARQLLWFTAWRAGLQHPLLGVGFGHFGDAYLLDRPKGEPEGMVKLSRRPEDPHNEPLKVLGETGWVGLLLWCGWIGLSLRARLRQPGPETAGLMVLLANSLSNCFAVALWPLLLVWTTPEAETPPARAGHPAGVLVLLLSLLLALPGWWMQHVFWWDDEWAARAGDGPERAVYYLEKRRLGLNGTAWLCPPWEKINLALHQAGAWVELGKATREQVAWDQAEAAARRRLALEPGNAFAWIGLADVFSRQGRWSESISYWQEAQRRDSGNPHTLFLLAVAQYYAGLKLEALKSLDHVLEIYSKSSEVYRFRAQIMIDQGMVWEGYWDWVRSEQLREGE